MILDTHVETKVAVKTYQYWFSLGYDVFPPTPRNNTSQVIQVKVGDLQPGSNISVRCRCDKCGEEYTQRFCRNTDVCDNCRLSSRMSGNTLGKANKGKTYPQISGHLHPRFNPRRKEFLTYSSKVRWITKKNYDKYIHIINPNGLPRGKCGVEGAYQLDHVRSIKECFDLGLPPEVAGAPENLQMLPWKVNRAKSIYK